MADALALGLVFLGGGIGSLARWQVGLAIHRRYGGPFPLGTLVINVSGSFIIGLLCTLLGIGLRGQVDDEVTALVLTGLLGGYTTFSSYELETLELLQARRRAMAAGYWVGSVAAGLAAAFLGRLVGDALALAR